MTVLIPPPLHSYTSGRSEVEGKGDSLSDVLSHLDETYPGLRFRIIDEQNRVRPHIKIFINTELAPVIDRSVSSNDMVQIICALSGG